MASYSNYYSATPAAVSQLSVPAQGTIGTSEWITNLLAGNSLRDVAVVPPSTPATPSTTVTWG